MVSLGVYDPEDLRKYNFFERRTFYMQTWSGFTGLYVFYALKSGGYFPSIPMSRGGYIAAFSIPALLIGSIMTVSSASYFSALDDKYYPLHLERLKNLVTGDK